MRVQIRHTVYFTFSPSLRPWEYLLLVWFIRKLRMVSLPFTQKFTLVMCILTPCHCWQDFYTLHRLVIDRNWLFIKVYRFSGPILYCTRLDQTKMIICTFTKYRNVTNSDGLMCILLGVFFNVVRASVRDFGSDFGWFEALMIPTCYH